MKNIKFSSRLVRFQTLLPILGILLVLVLPAPPAHTQSIPVQLNPPLSIPPESPLAHSAGSSDEVGIVQAAASFSVSTFAELSAAITQANSVAGDDTITIAADITFSAQLPVITSNITFIGGGHTLDGDQTYRIFQINSGTVNISDLVLANGDGGAQQVAGGILMFGGTANITNVTFTGHTSSFSGAALDLFGGGAANITNSTFYDNSTLHFGAAIINDGGTTNIVNTTFYNNTANQGDTIASNSPLTFKNTIFANDPGDSNCLFLTPATDLGGNLQYPDTSCGASIAVGDPLLGPLQDNGGLTPTMALGAGSPAIDIGVACPPPATDQRGVARPQRSACDSGAFEASNTAPVATDDSYTINEDTALTVPAPGVLGNDSDADGDPLAAVLVTTVGNGTLTLNLDGSFSYTPNADFSGMDSFTYLANDGTDDSNVATVSLTVVSAADQITQLAADVQALVDSGALRSSHGRALINKLDSAQKLLEKGNINAAIDKLYAFIDQVNDFIDNGHLTSTEGQALIDAANAVIYSLS